MAIRERIKKDGSKSYQVRLRGSDGFWITDTFERKLDAKAFEVEAKHKQYQGNFVISLKRELTLNQYWQQWKESGRLNVTEGWKRTQEQMLNDYIAPSLGEKKVSAISPVQIAQVLKSLQDKGRSAQTSRHVFNLLHKMFRDAVEDFQLLNFNPVLRKLKPRIASKERKHLRVEQSLHLLNAVAGEKYELAVWLGLVAGLRVGEIQALKWQNVDLDQGIIHIRGTYARKEKCFRDYPKGRAWHSIKMPFELWELLNRAKKSSTSEHVVTGDRRGFMIYDSYRLHLRRYCRNAGFEELASHELRHSASAIWRAFGATKDDMRRFFAHSSSAITDTYMHDTDDRLGEIAKVMKLFPIMSGTDEEAL